MDIVKIVIVVVLLTMLYWIQATYVVIKKGFTEVIKGLESVDGRLRPRQEK